MVKTYALLKTVCYAGQILLESGAETYRVEETMERIAHSFKVTNANSFVTTTGIMFSFEYEGETFTKVLRIRNRNIDLHKIDLINDLSRNIERNADLDLLHSELERIAIMPKYPTWLLVLFSGISAAGFAMFFQGDVKEWCIAFVLGILLRCFMLLFSSYKINSFFINGLGAGFVALCSLSLYTVGFLDLYNIVIISTIMLLVPGLAITNAIRDYVAGDLVSGLTRFTEAFLIALSIAVGSGFAFTLWNGFIGGLFL
ncbi:MAG: threonine/serine exporter family protein [Erysipelotrichaceae bacterium]